MKKYFPIILAAFVFLAACGNKDEEKNNEQANDAERALLPLEVDILTEEDAFNPGEEGKLEIKVTEGDEAVSDADEVLFEIWKHGHQNESEEIEGNSDGEGVYSLPYTFEEEGIYYVIPHVTARGKHTMPKKAFNVGGVEAPVEEEGEHEHHEHHDDEGHHHDENFSIHIVKPDMLKATENLDWFVHLEKDGKPFTEADVRYEYWKTDDEQHHFVEASETKEGEYKAKWMFDSTGEYNVQVHVEKDELHEHKEITFQVD